MPNWKLSPAVTEGMLKACEKLTQRRINVAQTGFPLTREDLELCAVGHELLAKFEDIASYGVASLTKTGGFIFWLDALSGLERKALVNTYTEGEAYYLNDEQTNRWKKKWTLPIDRVPPGKLEALVKWTNNLVRETRMREITQGTVRWFLHGRGQATRQHWLGVDFITACHVMANWPALAMLVDGKPGDRAGYGGKWVSHDWKIKFQSVPSNLDRWRTSNPEFVKKQSAIKLATMFLTSCEMLPVEPPKEPVTATLEEWVRLPGDPD